MNSLVPFSLYQSNKFRHLRQENHRQHKLFLLASTHAQQGRSTGYVAIRMLQEHRIERRKKLC